MAKGKDLKPHIGIFGRRNNGKSSFINLLTQQDTAIVSEQAGTTTDPVKKSVEIFGIGPCVLIDTAGTDDSGELGKKRIERSFRTIQQIDLAVLILSNNQFDETEKKLIEQFDLINLPYVLIHNKRNDTPIALELKQQMETAYNKSVLDIHCLQNDYRQAVIDVLKSKIPSTAYVKPSLFEGLVKAKDLVLLITPIDSEAPEGRMILPQVMALRDVLDRDAIAVVVKETEISDFMAKGIRPDLVVTDSQAFALVNPLIPDDIPLTGFSVLFARIRANFEAYLQGTPYLSKLEDGDRLLILESCTHQISCEDIGRFKLPRWIREYTGKTLEFDVVAGFDPSPHPIESYAMVIQCGGCVVTQRQLKNRLQPAIQAGVPVSNYGMAIAYLHGMFDRALRAF